MKIPAVIIIIIFILLGSMQVFAAETENFQSAYYVFHLYYDNGKLSADRDYRFAYDVLGGEFAQKETGDSSYSGEIRNNQNKVVAGFHFEPFPTGGETHGRISVKAPYVSDGSLAIFYNPEGKEVLRLSVGSSAVCNNNGKCDAGEDSKNCFSDCKPGGTGEPAPFASLKPSLSATPLPTAGEGGNAGGIAVAGVLVALLGAGGWFGWKWWQRKRGGQALPPAAGRRSQTGSFK